MCSSSWRTALPALAAVLATTSPAPASEPATAGAALYAEHCAVCHGTEGRGDGQAAERFAVKPRDFVAAEYRFRSTASGKLPTDDDLRRSIVNGLGGTGMVPQDHLSSAEVDAVIAHLKILSPRFAADPAPQPMKLPQSSPRTAASLARGAQVYREAGCGNCHGERGRGDGTSAGDLSQQPADLTRRPLKGGSTAADIVRAVVTGLNGTPMPSYHLLYDDPDMWALAHYVESLGAERAAMTDQEKIGWEVEKRTPSAEESGRSAGN